MFNVTKSGTGGAGRTDKPAMDYSITMFAVEKPILVGTGAGGARAVLMSLDRMAEFTAIEECVEISLSHYQPAETFERQFAACLAHDTLDRVGTITAPRLIMSGDEDPLVPHQNSLILDELIPGSELVFFPDGRHVFFVEHAEEFNQRVTSVFKPAA